MRIILQYFGQEKEFNSDAAQILIGRAHANVTPDLDLAPDMTVSPLHARLWLESGVCCIEDLNSESGTRVNEEEIKGQGRVVLRATDMVTIGETQLRIQTTPSPAYARDRTAKEIASNILEITSSLDASKPALAADEINNLDELRQRLTLFYELPLRFGEVSRLDTLLQVIVERVVSVIRHAERGAVLVKEKNGKLALKAHLPAGNPAVSMTLATRAMNDRSAFIWSPIALPKQQIPNSIGAYRIESAMYAPLLWQGEIFGSVCVDNETGAAFTPDDLRLLQAVAHHAAMAVANLKLHEERRQQMDFLDNMLRLVDPQIGAQLKQRGQVRLGGDFRDVTILLADIRGFTNLSATMSPQQVTEMLGDYFGCLVPLIFKYQGTVDKYVGDAILAVFGSPAADEKQHLHGIQAAIEMQAGMREVNARRDAQDKRTGQLGIGIHCGEVVHGLIGTAQRMEYTVIGDTVNRASRYCDGAGGGEVLISSELYQWVWNAVDVEQTSIATKHEGNLVAYRIKNLRDAIPC